MISVTLNGNTVPYRQGILIDEKLNENLDTGVLIIPQVVSTAIEPMDQVVITDSSVSYTKYMLVSSIKRMVSSFKTPREYNYELGLISPTIQLQRIVLPNRSITQSLIVANRKDIYTVMSEYVSLYAPSFSLSTALVNKVTGVICPEFQWNRPTLFEVFNDLLSVVDSVVTMTTFTQISFLDLNVQGSAISTDIISNEELTQTVEDYASSIEVEAKNAVIKRENTRTIEWIAPKTTRESMVTTENAELILDKPIYKINKITARIIAVAFTFQAYEVDITDYVVEKSVYELLRTSNSTGFVTGDFKRNRLYFTEGSNLIEGLTYNEDAWLSITTKNALINVFRNAYLAAFSVDVGGNLTNGDTLKFVFKVDYTSTNDVKFSTKKYDTVSHNSVLINNQDTSYVDITQFAKKQQQTVNRLGNQNFMIMSKELSYTDLPSLGDYYDTNYKLTSRTISLYDTYVTFLGDLTKNYVNKSLYTGLNMKRRYTQIADERDAFESNHLNDVRFNVSHTSNSTSATLENWMWRFGQADENIKMVVFVSHYADTTNSVFIGVSGSAYALNNSVVYTFKMDDNFSAGTQVLAEDIFLGTRLGIKNVQYVDSDGEFVYYTVDFYKYYINPDLNDDDITGEPSKWNDGLEVAREYPELDATLLDGANIVFASGSKFRYKDNREITVETYQFFVNSDSNIFFGELYFELHPMIYTETTDEELFLSYSLDSDDLYKRGDQVALGNIVDTTSITITITGNRLFITPLGAIDTLWPSVKSWSICDSNGNLYIGVNGNDKNLYMNKL